MDKAKIKEEIKKVDKVLLFEWLSMMTVFITCFLFLFYRIERVENNISELNKSQCARTDHLYEMFIDLIKETKKG